MGHLDRPDSNIWFKSRSVSTELYNDNWIRNIKNINNSTLMEEFVTLYAAMSSVNLSN
jgi:hypothetical protein